MLTATAMGAGCHNTPVTTKKTDTPKRNLTNPTNPIP
jgi:hypothetical protein